MSIGKNGQFYYSPDIAVYIKTAQNGVINISEDIMSFTVQRQLNGVSTAQIILANFGFKYTPGSNVAKTAPGVIPPQPLINTMDQIVIFLKRTEYFQTLTGFVTYAPVISIMPTPVSIQASCTLYKTQNSYWDSGSLDFAGLIPNTLFNIKNTDYADGGAGQGIVNILTDVCNWPAKNIRIGTIPQKWFNFAAGIGDTSATSTKHASGNASGTSGLEVVTSLAKSKAKSFVPGAPAGTNLPATLVVHEMTANTFKRLISTGTSTPVYQQTIKDVNRLDNGVNYWIVLPLPFNTGNPFSSNPSPQSWVAGTDPQKNTWPWPSNLTDGRLIQIKSANGGIVWANVIAVANANAPAGSISTAAFQALAGSQANPREDLTITIDGWVNPTTAPYPLQGAEFETSAANNQSPTIPTTTGTHEKSTSLTGVFTSIAQVQSVITDELNISDPSTMDSYTWAYVLLRSLGVPKGSSTLDRGKPSNSIGNIAGWINAEGVYWLYEPTNLAPYPPEGHSYNDPLDTGLDNKITPQVKGQHRGNSDSPFSYQTVAMGIFASQQTLLYSTYNTGTGVGTYKSVIAALTSNAPLAQFAAALEPTHWGGSNTYGNNANGSTPVNLSGQLKNAISKLQNQGTVYNEASWNNGVSGGTPSSYVPAPGTASDPNFNITGIVPSVSPAGTILQGLPSAFIVDEQALSTISTLATGGLRVFQSAPNGDFVSWFPDYFGLYGTRASLQIFDIEIIDLKIYHDDTQLTTHSAVSGDTTGIGEAVTLNDWLSSKGVIAITDLNILRMLFGINTGDKTNKLAKIFGLGSDPEVPAYFMQRYGLRPYVDEEPLIHSHALETAFAIQSFLYLWSKQYATEVMLTFMPELYPGMIVQLPEHNLQVFVLNVTHQGSRDGGFTTQATFTCPTLVNIKDVTTGEIIGDPIPYHYGYPIRPK